MAELGRLLTFMYEDDRQTALAMYNRMFDETADEQGLLQLLVSPTRQAVVLARSYDAKERKHQIECQNREDYDADPEDVPAFVFLIDKTAQQAAELGVRTDAVAEGQFSIFDEVEEQAWPEAEPAEADEPATPEAAEPVTLPAPEPLPEKEPASMDAPEAEQAPERSEVDETADALEALLTDFIVENGELVSARPEEEEAGTEALSPEQPGPTEALDEETVILFEPEAYEEPSVQYVQKTNIFLLIIYIFLAIPLGLIGLGILLLPTLLSLALSLLCVYVGVSLVGSCFGSFAVIADTMVVFGAGLILVALSLLFVWIFIWFLGVAIPGFVRAVCRLGRKICCKEVAIQ